MTYNPNEPKDEPPPVIATAQMRTNFAQFQTIFSNNHFALNTSNQGKHEKVIFQRQVTEPTITSNYISLYSNNITTASSAEPQLFLKIPKFLPNNQINSPTQLTFNAVNIAGPVYQTFLPGGYIMYFGEVGTVPSTIILNPVCTRIACVVVCANNYFVKFAAKFQIQSWATIISPNSFTINADVVTFPPVPATVRINWIAIGIQ